MVERHEAEFFLGKQGKQRTKDRVSSGVGGRVGFDLRSLVTRVGGSLH
jgi:hypothetical protein